MHNLILPKPHLSASQIGSYDFCPRSYYMQSVLGIFNVGESAFMGKISHYALEFAYWWKKRYKTNPDPKTIMRVFDKAFRKGVGTITHPEGGDLKLLYAYGLQFIKKHVTRYLPDMDVDEVERGFNIEINGIKVVGFIDLEESGNMVWDHKFRYKTLPKGKYKADRDLQLTLYAYATGRENVGYIIHYLKEVEGELKPAIMINKASRTTQDIEEMKDRVLKTAELIDRDIRRGEFSKVFQKRCSSSKSGWVCAFHDQCWGEKRLETEREMKIKLESLVKKHESAQPIDPEFKLPAHLTADPEVAALPFL